MTAVLLTVAPLIVVYFAGILSGVGCMFLVLYWFRIDIREERKAELRVHRRLHKLP